MQNIKLMVRKSWIVIVIVLFFVIVISYVIYERHQAVKWLKSFQPPIATSLIQFSNISQLPNGQNNYPGEHYLVNGVTTNIDTKPHSFKFVIEFYSGDRFILKSDIVTITNLVSGQSVSFNTDANIVFGRLEESAKAIPKIFSFDSNTFDSSNHCTRRILWYMGQSESCWSGGL